VNPKAPFVNESCGFVVERIHNISTLNRTRGVWAKLRQKRKNGWLKCCGQRYYMLQPKMGNYECKIMHVSQKMSFLERCKRKCSGYLQKITTCSPCWNLKEYAPLNWPWGSRAVGQTVDTH